MNRKGICCAGNWVIDHVKTVTVWPQEETLSSIVAEELGTGGSAYNVSVDLARFELEIPLSGVGLVGEDADGQRILDDCMARRIDASRVKMLPGVSTSYTDVMSVQASGRRTFFHHRGANALFGPEHVPVADLDCRLFNLGYLLLLDTMDEEDPQYGTKAARVLASLQAAGIWTSIDVVSEDSDRFTRIVTPALPHSDYCIINEIEASRTTGKQIRKGAALDRGEMEAAAHDLLKRGVKRLVVIHAPEGSLGVPAQGSSRWQAAHALPEGYIKGTVGAGDAFMAGMLLGIHESWDLERSLCFATAAAATCLRHPTTTGGVGCAKEIDELAAGIPYLES